MTGAPQVIMLGQQVETEAVPGSLGWVVTGLRGVVCNLSSIEQAPKGQFSL